MAIDDLPAARAALKRWLFEDALPLWAGAGRDAATGGFQEALDLQGRPLTDLPRRARVQARQLYVYALAGRLGWEGPWREAVEGAIRFIAHFRRADGLYRSKVDREGRPLDETAVLYDQAFFLFAGAAAAQALPERRAEFERQALHHLQAVEAHFRHAGGGFKEADGRRPFQSNPHMHLLEAARAWEALTGGATRWSALADQIGELCLHRFIDGRTGALREFFDAEWAPAAGEDGRIVEPGHQFEWAWLLAGWGRARGREDALAAAARLQAIGEGPGVDEGRGVAVNALDDSLRPLDPAARLWPQTERIKAAVALGAGEAVAARAVAGLTLYLDVEPRGLWRDRMRPDGGWVEEPAPASSFYHIVCALAELGL